MKRHRLRREIIATVLDNDMVNTCGPTFPGRLRAAAACDTAALAIGYQSAKMILRFDDVWNAVAALDGRAPASVQTALFAELARVLRGQTFWMARRVAHKGAARPTPRRGKSASGGGDTSVQALIDAYRPAVDELRPLVPAVLSPLERTAVDDQVQVFVREGAPLALARAVAALRTLTTVADLSDLASASGWPVKPVARLYHQVGGMFGFDLLRRAAGSLAAGDAFERLAVRRLVEDMLSEQAILTRAIMSFAAGAQAGESAADAKAAVASWSALHAEPAQAARGTIEAIEAAGDGWSFAKLTIVNAALRELAVAAS
jgi:glutamate dehydrogenase